MQLRPRLSTCARLVLLALLVDALLVGVWLQVWSALKNLVEQSHELREHNCSFTSHVVIEHDVELFILVEALIASVLGKNSDRFFQGQDVGIHAHH